MPSKAKDIWKQFEKKIGQELNIRPNAYCVAIPNEIRGMYGKRKPIQVVTPFDFAASIDGRAIFFDAKTCGETTFNLQSLVLRKQKNHQWQELIKARDSGSAAGYLIWFYKYSIIIWASVEDIEEAIKQGKKSLNITHRRSQVDDTPLDLASLVWKQ